VWVSDYPASSGGEENGEIDRGLLKCFLLLRTVVPAVCNMGEKGVADRGNAKQGSEAQAKNGGD